MKTIIDFFLRKLLKWRKYKTLREVMTDIEFIESHKAAALATNDAELRAQLAREQTKEKQDYSRIEELTMQISEGRAVKTELAKLKQVAVELPQYMEML